MSLTTDAEFSPGTSAGLCSEVPSSFDQQHRCRTNTDIAAFRHQCLRAAVGARDDEEAARLADEVLHENVRIAAIEYLGEAYYSKERLAQKLRSDGFTDREITEALGRMQIDWHRHAFYSAAEYVRECAKVRILPSAGDSRTARIADEVRAYLQFLQFTQDEADSAVSGILSMQVTAAMAAAGRANGKQGRHSA